MRLIDADALMQKIEKITEKVAFEQARGGNQFRSVVCMACKKLLISLLKDTPTIDPVKHGRWITGCGNPFIDKCSVCKNDYRLGVKYFYCPHCGARMDEVKDDDDDACETDRR